MAKNKYGAIRTEYNGEKYDSKKEAAYAAKLDLLRKAEKPVDRVVSVVRQCPYPIIINGIKVCKYICDFQVQYGDGRIEVIDCKGYLTPIYRLKKKLMLACHGVSIIEV